MFLMRTVSRQVIFSPVPLSMLQDLLPHSAVMPVGMSEHSSPLTRLYGITVPLRDILESQRFSEVP